ncbi:MAG: RNA methyltransferase [Saprospiraceae bacterium]|nr:RNA methyltransferase [Saprospiraceae bacterium]
MAIVGPEGDFTDEEIQLLIDAGFHPVSLGPTILRSETAGMVAASLLKLL